MPSEPLSDQALSIFAFAAYHSLVSGERVRSVVLEDHKGHHADSEGVDELEKAGLLDAQGERGTFTEDGEAMLQRLIESLRRAVR